VVTRYPGLITKAETAEKAIKQVERVRNFVRRKLGIK
jgi:hypothetical protein